MKCMLIQEQIKFYNKGLKKKAYDIIHVCKTCKKVKYYNKSMKPPLKTINVENLHDLLYIDFYGSLQQGRGGVKYILVCLNAFSKYVKLYAL